MGVLIHFLRIFFINFFNKIEHRKKALKMNNFIDVRTFNGYFKKMSKTCHVTPVYLRHLILKIRLILLSGIHRFIKMVFNIKPFILCLRETTFQFDLTCSTQLISFFTKFVEIFFYKLLTSPPLKNFIVFYLSNIC